MSTASTLPLWAIIATRWLMNISLKVTCFLFWPLGLPSKVERLCIHRVGQIGDMVCALTAMRAIRERFPSAQITLLSSAGETGNQGIVGLEPALPWLDQIIFYSAESLTRKDGIRALRAELAQMKFDLWIALPQDLTNLQTEFRNLVFAKWVGVRWAGGFFVNTLRSHLRQQLKLGGFERESKILFDRAERMGVAIPTSAEVFTIPSSDQKRMQKKICVAGLLDGRPLLAIAPGGKRLQNLWPVERFSELAKRWSDQGGAILIIGGLLDSVLADSIQYSCGVSSSLNFCGETSLVESLALLQHCRALVSNDSGPMHLAAAIGTPCVVAFSARDFPVKWFPQGSGHSVIRKDLECSPCLTEQCAHANICTTQITVDEMWRALVPHFSKLSLAK
jgi:heptosyltransferase-3